MNNGAVAGTTDPRRLATFCQSCYLANLLLLPGLAFMPVLWIFVKFKQQQGWQRDHLFRALQLSLLAGLLLLLVPGAVVLYSGRYEESLVQMLLYFITLHTTFVLIGMLNLARAMVQKPPIF
jgi:hypothetical protein